MRRTHALFALMAALATPTVHAQQQAPVYRCGSTYSQAPCPGGKEVNADDARTPEQQQQARDLAQREAERGEAMARERRTAEAARPAGQGAAGIRHAIQPGQEAVAGPSGRKPSKTKTVTVKKTSKKSVRKTVVRRG